MGLVCNMGGGKEVLFGEEDDNDDNTLLVVAVGAAGAFVSVVDVTVQVGNDSAVLESTVVVVVDAGAVRLGKVAATTLFRIIFGSSTATASEFTSAVVGFV